MRAGKVCEHGRNLAKRDIDGPSTSLADEVLMVAGGFKMNDGRSMAQVDMMQGSQLFEHVDRSIDRG